jgi:hypothetical protein
MNESSNKQFQLSFSSLSQSARRYAFPCSADYRYARAIPGLELGVPAVQVIAFK